MKQLIGDVLAQKEGTPERAERAGILLASLREHDVLLMWTRALWAGRGNAVTSKDDFESIAAVAVFDYLTDSGAHAATPGVLCSVARRAAQRYIAEGGEHGLAGYRGLTMRSAIYADIRDSLTAKLGREPTSAEVFAWADTHAGQKQTKNGERLDPGELSHYRNQGRLGIAPVMGDELSLATQTDVESDGLHAAEVSVLMRHVTDTILQEAVELCGVVWYANQLAVWRSENSPGVADSLVEVNDLASVTSATGKRLHDLIVSNKTLNTLVGSGASLSLVARSALAAAPGECGLLTYLCSWVQMAADGKTAQSSARPMQSAVVAHVRETTGTVLSQRQATEYSRALAAALDRTIQLHGPIDAAA